MLTYWRGCLITILLVIAVGLEQTAIANPVPSPGFLVIAPDHEYLANEQVKASWAELRNIIEDASRDGGRVLVISNRLTGTGSYRRLLAGLDYTLNGQGIAPHPNLTRWIEEQIIMLLKH